MRRSPYLSTWLVAALVGCGGSVIRTTPFEFGAAERVEIDGLTPCTARSVEPRHLDPGRPLVVLVHGCNDSAARFSALAEVFEAHDQQAVCFTYESRDKIETAAQSLASALQSIEHRAPGQPVKVIGHSQGGLVARRALTQSVDKGTLHGDYELVTISSPFAGIRQARHCAHRWLYALSLGITPAICRSVAGKNWTEIHRGSTLVTEPGELGEGVGTYLQVRTDERQSCRVLDADGACEEDDFVFSLEEQHNPKITGPRVRAREVVSGHVEIVGDGREIPTTLIDVLQSEGILNPTPLKRRDEVARLLREIYLDMPESAGPLQAARR